MKRCDLCHRLIWPWQHYGFRVGMAIWHTRCKLARQATAVERILGWLE